MKLTERTVRENVVFKGKILEVHDDDAEAADGRACKREIVRHPGGAAVLAVLDGKIPLVRQYRYAYGEEVLEIPAGKLEADRSPEACAARELEEETGCVPKRLVSLGELYPSVGYTDERIHLYLCTEAERRAQKLDDGEFLDVVELTPEELAEAIRSNAVRDAKTIVAFERYLTEYKTD